MRNYTKEEIRLLSGTRGLRYLLDNDPPNLEKALRKLKFKRDLNQMQVDLIQLQNWVVENQKRLLLIFEGTEFAGKGGMIRSIVEHLNPRSVRVVALPKPSEREAGQWYFQRYVNQLPERGEIVLFDRSWYNRAIVEPVNGFCTRKQYNRFMSEVNHFENMLYNDGIHLFKIFISITKKTQAKRIDMIKENPLRRWELSPVDLNAQKNWNRMKRYEKKMFDQTNTKKIPWIVVDGNDAYKARLEMIRILLGKMHIHSRKK